VSGSVAFGAPLGIAVVILTESSLLLQVGPPSTAFEAWFVYQGDSSVIVKLAVEAVKAIATIDGKDSINHCSVEH